MSRHYRYRTIVACWLIGVAGVMGAAAAAGDVPVGGGEDLPIKPPLPIWPADLETTTNRQPTFRVNGRFQATKYRVELAKDAGFTQAIVIDRFQVAADPGITPVVLVPCEGEPLADGQYFWRAFAGNDQGFWTPPANYRTFFVSSQDRDKITAGSEVIHPRLLLTAEDIPQLRSRIERSAHLSRGWRYQVNAAMSTLSLEPPDEAYAKAGAGQHGNYSSAAVWYHRHLENVAFVGVVTGNRRLLAKGVEMLMAACAYQRWLGPLFDQREYFDPPWNSALETAMMTAAVATGYDLLYQHLTDDQRQTVRQAIAEKGVRMLVHDWADPIGSSQIPRHQLPTGNWVMVCASSAGVGALAILGEHPEAADWVRLVRNRVRAWLNDRGGDWYVDNPYPGNRPAPIPVIGPSEPNFGVNGGYKESISYMNYAMGYVCIFADALGETTGEDLFIHVPGNLLDPMAWSIMAWPFEGGMKSALVDLGDCGASTSWYATLHAALIKHRSDARAAWLYRRTIPVPIGPRSLLWYEDRVVDAPPDRSVPMGVFRTIGQVVMRSGWSPDTPMAAIKFRQNRGHLDIGTFYLFGAGHPTIIDSGSCNYGGEIYQKYCSQSVAHNVVLVDDRPQVRADGRLLAAVGTSAVTAASGQLAAAYPEALKSWTRDLLMLPGGVALVADHLEGNGQHQFDLVLHPENPFTLRSSGELLVGKEPAETVVNVYSDGPFAAQQQDGYYTTLPRKYLRFNAGGQAESRAFLTVCQWPMGRNHERTPLTVTPLDAGRWRIDSAEGASRAAVRVGPSDDEYIVSDARLSAVWQLGQAARHEHVVLLAGKRLAVEGRELLNAAQPVSAAVEFDEPLRAHFWSEAPAQVTLAAPVALGEVFLNGKKVAGSRGRQSVTVDVPAGESDLVVAASDRALRRLPPLVSDDLPAVTVPDAPAYHSNVVTPCSTSWSDGLDAIDGDPNTAWISLPGAPMPQWLEVQLPKAEAIRQVEIGTGLPCAGRLETWQDATRSWVEQGRFETTPTEPSRVIRFEPVEVSRLRVVIERIDAANNAATIYNLRWDE